MEFAKGLIIPILADYVLSPEVFYGGDLTGIYFQTEDNQFGRITFDKLDAIKVCRGENLPFTDDWKTGQKFSWVYKIENSKWLEERFNYENKNYGNSYEFGRNINEMLTDFSHYLFQFHDQFIEVISRGFWFEKAGNSLFKIELQKDHPFLPLEEIEVKQFEILGIKYKAIFNPIPVDELMQNSQYCQQKIVEIAIEFEEEYLIIQTLVIMQRQGKLVSVLSPLFGKTTFEKNGLATFDDIKPIIDKEVTEIAERKKQMRK